MKIKSLAWGVGLLLATFGLQSGHAQSANFGTTYFEFEAGGDNANNGGVNVPEDAHAWWRANSVAMNGTPYTLASPDVFRAANAGQEWTYEFDLPDDASTVFLRMEAHQDMKVSISGPEGVDSGNHQSFTGTQIFAATGMSHTPVSVDLTSYINGATNPEKKIYLRFEPNGAAGALLFHLRLDNGFPSFVPGASYKQYDDRPFIVASPGNTDTGGGWRAVDAAQYVIYQLTLPAATTTAFAAIRVQGQYSISLGTSTGGPWTQAAVATPTANHNYVLKTEVVDLSPYLVSNPSKTVYLLMQDSDSANGNGALWSGVEVYPHDPRADYQNLTFGTAYAEFEVGGAGASDLATSNLAEGYHQWWILNAVGAGGTPYTTDNVYRAANASQQWTYRFDLPDDATTAVLRVLGHQAVKISASGPAGVDINNPQNFTGTTFYNQSGLNFTPISIDLSSLLAGNPTKQLFVRFEAGSTDAVVFHCRLDNGFPSFTPAPSNSRWGDEEFIAATNGSISTGAFRATDGSQYVVYELDLPDSYTAAEILVDVEQQYKLSLASALAGPFTVVGQSAAQSGNRTTLTIPVTSYLTGNPTKKVYLRLEDSDTADGFGGLLHSLQFNPLLTPVELSSFDAQ